MLVGEVLEVVICADEELGVARKCVSNSTNFNELPTNSQIMLLVDDLVL